jgi:hypothetical protein
MPWTEPTGPEAYRISYGHKLLSGKDLGPKICDCLDSLGVLWTTIDVVPIFRFVRIIRLKEGGEPIDPSIDPIVLLDWCRCQHTWRSRLSGVHLHPAACSNLPRTYSSSRLGPDHR